MDKIKISGKVYTPNSIVKNMLDFMKYRGAGILKQNIMDNSCGDGAFLIEIVKRYCKVFLKGNKNLKTLKTELEKYIYGIESDREEVLNCKLNLDKAVKEFNIKNVCWNIIEGDALEISKFNKQMDFVIGNPPYIRVHNLNDNYNKVKKFAFAQSGMTDIYIVFFEIGFNMLNEKGKMCLITPSSFFKSRAGEVLRHYIQTKRNLVQIVDLEHSQVFEATTYNSITLFDNRKNEYIDYFVYNENNKKFIFIDKLKYENLFINGKMFISKTEQIEKIKEIENYYQELSTRQIMVKNGFATLADNVFIGNLNIESPFIIDIIKASTGKWEKCIFPYLPNGSPISETELKKDKTLYKYLLDRKDILLNRDIENKNSWFLFGRTQAIKDVYKYKIAISHIVKTLDSIKLNEVLPGQAVYSGLYILSDFSFAEIQSAILNADFIEYLKLLKNYKNCGYYTFSSLELEKYLNYKLTADGTAEAQKIFA